MIFARDRVFEVGEGSNRVYREVDALEVSLGYSSAMYMRTRIITCTLITFLSFLFLIRDINIFSALLLYMKESVVALALVFDC